MRGVGIPNWVLTFVFLGGYYLGMKEIDIALLKSIRSVIDDIDEFGRVDVDDVKSLLVEVFDELQILENRVQTLSNHMGAAEGLLHSALGVLRQERVLGFVDGRTDEVPVVSSLTIVGADESYELG